MKKVGLFLVFIWIVTTASVIPSYNTLDDDPMIDFLLEYVGIKYRGYEFDRFIYIAAKRQKLYVVNNGEVEQSYVISTAKNGMGSASGSFCTPSGLHEIAEKVGDGLPVNSIIKNKMPTGAVAEVVTQNRSTGEDIITTRILHLRGMEDDVNRGEGFDSYSRGIFIHGTHEEGLLGTPASKGCVRMSNSEILQLFESVEVGTFVVILNN
jgi:lipoprotein-anchoring transpeptidase ErfK/SrfK